MLLAHFRGGGMAQNLLGIDLGTSGVRAAIFDDSATLLGLGTRQYSIQSPMPGHAEQSPEEWWKLCAEAVRDALKAAGISGGDLTGISFSGQMHGTVLLDDYGDPVSPAIIWADRRSESVLDEIEETVGSERKEKMIMNRAFPGTQAATLVWIKHNNIPLWRKTVRVLSPKDYLRFRFCGYYHTEPSDASATLLFDIDLRDWAEKVIDSLGIPSGWLPFVINSDQMVGETEDIEEETGIPDGIPVVMGGGDQPCAALANGVIEPGSLLLTVGTGGQLFAPLKVPAASPDYSLNTFCHLTDSRAYVMGATLAAGMSLSWFRDTLCKGSDFASLSDEAATIAAGSDGLRFTPYLTGRRSPVLDPSASASFSGLAITHERGHFVRAVMEGVAFELRENLEAMRTMGVKVDHAVCSGGVLNSPVWLEILANVLDLPLKLSERQEQASFGAALIAGIGSGIYSGWREAAALADSTTKSIEPEPSTADYYNEIYESLKKAR